MIGSDITRRFFIAGLATCLERDSSRAVPLLEPHELFSKKLMTRTETPHKQW